MKYRLLALAAMAAALPAVEARQMEKSAPDAVPLVRLAPQAQRKPASPLAHRLFPDPLDLVEGNAAPIWLRASMAARGVRFKWTEKEWKWDHPGEGGTALKDLPQKEVRAVLDKHASAFRLARHAALRTRCDWERPAPTLQNLSDDVALDDIQSTRELARLLSLRCRLELREKDFDAALQTLQIGFTLARHIAEAKTLIQDLVAIAIAHIMLGRVEEWLQTPGSPNLYWALTDLPRPFVDVRPVVRSELNTLYRSFPQLRELKKQKLTADEALALIDKVFDAAAGFGGERPPKVAGKLAVAALTLKYYPDAKKGLIEAGRPQKEVEALPAVQAVALYFLEQYDQTSGEVLKWLAVPAWQGLERLHKAEATYGPKGPKSGNIFVALLMPAIVKTYQAQLRLDRYLAGLRGAEALRQYAAAHGGKAPARWSDIPDPDPIDPITGKGLEAWYKAADGRGELDVPPPPPATPRLGRRYVVGEGKGEGR